MHIFPAINSRRVFLFFILTGLILTVVFGWTTRQHASGVATPNGNSAGGALTPFAGPITVNTLTDVVDPNDGRCSLREAITAANSNTASGPVAGECAAGSAIGSDVINFSVSGTISPTVVLPDLSSDLSISGPGSSQLTVSGSNLRRIFRIQSGSTVAISDLTLANGVTGSPGGGAIYNGGTLTLTNCNLYGNAAPDGGAIYNDGPSATITGCNVGGPGAGQPNNANQAGGGILNNQGTVTITNSLIAANVAQVGGGGLATGAPGTNGNFNVANSTISGNLANQGRGGGVYVASGSHTFTNVTITANLADKEGGGIYQSPSALVPAQTTLRNTIVAGNNSRGTFQPVDNIAGDVDSSSSFNLIGNRSSTNLTNGVNNNQFVANPRLGALANNGGPTMTHSLLPGSLALDAGNNTFAINAGLTLDQRGFTRIVDSNDADAIATVDIGAFEAQVSVEDIADKTINEDTQLQITFGVGGGVTSVTASSSNTTLVPNNAANIAVTGAGSSRTLTINPAANEFGTSTISVTVNGSGGQSMTDTFLLTVNSVNDVPSFTKGPDLTVNNNLGAQIVPNWATNISAGPANESGQTLAFQITGNTNPSVVASPAIGPNGTLTYIPQTSGGTATITVVLKDNGGTANGGVDTSPPQSFNITVVPVGGFISFTSATGSTTESSGFTTVTATRTGDLSRQVTVDYATSPDNGLPCSNANGTATPKCDFTAALGTLTFPPGADTKVINILISQDSFVEGPETFTISLLNPTNYAALGANPTSTITIADDATEPSTNAIDDARNFVRQHYHDFLNREADQAGWDFWTNQITSCGSDLQCIDVRRINVSAAFFISIEFQNNGYLVERFYKAAYGDATVNSTFVNPHQIAVPIVRLNEFLTDTQRIGRGVVVNQAGWETVLESNKQAYALEFVQTARFMTALPTTMTPAQFVDRLNQNTGGVLSLSERQTASNQFGGAGNTANVNARAQVVRMVADDADLVSGEFNRAFVLSEYFGYLRRNPNDPPDAVNDYGGYDFWLTKLNQANGDYIKSEMVKAFLSSPEYRQRFGQQ